MRGVVLADGVVEEAARGGELVLDVGELGLQLLEVRVGLEVRIGLRQRDQPAERAGQHAFSAAAFCRRCPAPLIAALRAWITASSVPLLVRGVALHGLDQVRDQVVALLQLHVDVGEGLVDALPQRDEAVVDAAIARARERR